MNWTIPKEWMQVDPEDFDDVLAKSNWLRDWWDNCIVYRYVNDREPFAVMREEDGALFVNPDVL